MKIRSVYFLFISLVQNEDSNSIAEALKIISQWNPEWKSKYFMVDFDTAEILALEDVFPGKLLKKTN